MQHIYSVKLPICTTEEWRAAAVMLVNLRKENITVQHTHTPRSQLIMFRADTRFSPRIYIYMCVCVCTYNNNIITTIMIIRVSRRRGVKNPHTQRRFHRRRNFFFFVIFYFLMGSLAKNQRRRRMRWRLQHRLNKKK